MSISFILDLNGKRNAWSKDSWHCYRSLCADELKYRNELLSIPLFMQTIRVYSYFTIYKYTDDSLCAQTADLEFREHTYNCVFMWRRYGLRNNLSTHSKKSMDLCETYTLSLRFMFCGSKLSHVHTIFILLPAAYISEFVKVETVCEWVCVSIAIVRKSR